MVHHVLATRWNLVCNLGIKCNTSPITVRAGIRYFSSPFDNMDSVLGFAQAGNLLATRFDGYFDRAKWHLRNHIPRNQTAVSAKIAWNADFPDLYYPHFYERWLGLTHADVQTWIHDEDGSLDKVWTGFSQTFSRRQARLIAAVQARNSVLFLRVEERSQMRRLATTDLDADAASFVAAVGGAFPDLDFAILYLYCTGAEPVRPGRTPPPPRPEPRSSDRVLFVPMPEDVSEPAFAETWLAGLRLHPRDGLQLSGDLLAD